MFRLFYLITDGLKETSSSNEDLLIDSSILNNRITYKVKALKEIELKRVSLDIDHVLGKKDQMFLNGYQSWTDTNVHDLSFVEKDVRKIPKIINKTFALTEYGDSRIFDYDKKLVHGYDVFYALGEKEYFSYSLNLENAFLLYVVDKKKRTISLLSDVDGIVLKEGEEIVVLDVKQFDSYEEGLKSFNEDFPPLNTPKILGYTSWYNHYQNINEKQILDDLDALDDRFDLFQIDDGYETFVGDFLDVDEKKFPNGLEPIVKKVHEKGMKAGIWLAPFIAETNSSLFKNRPELFIKDEEGNPIKCGGNWSWFYALDLTNEESWKHIEACLKKYMDMGFDFFKLDFLYTASGLPRKGVSRAMSATRAYKRLREILKDKLLLNCGAAISSSYKNCDYIRVGPDVSLSWDDAFYMRIIHRERVSTKITLRNTLTRFILNNHWFGNDPDVFVMRDTNVKMNEKQKEALLIINTLCSSIAMTSDNIKEYGESKNALLEKAFLNFKKAQDVSFKKAKNTFYITYTLDGEKKTLTYDSKHGEIIYG